MGTYTLGSDSAFTGVANNWNTPYKFEYDASPDANVAVPNSNEIELKVKPADGKDKVICGVYKIDEDVTNDEGFKSTTKLENNTTDVYTYSSDTTLPSGIMFCIVSPER